MNKEKDRVEELLEAISANSKSYHLAKFHGALGIVNTSDIMEEAKNTYYKEIIPAIDELSKEEKIRLRLELKVILRKKDLNHETNMLQSAVNHITEGLKVRKRKTEEEKVNTKNSSEEVDHIVDLLTSYSKSYKVACFHALFGMNTQDILLDLRSKYVKNVMHGIDNLKNDDKKVLKAKLVKISEKNDEDMHKQMIDDAIIYVTKSLRSRKNNTSVDDNEKTSTNTEVKVKAKTYKRRTKQIETAKLEKALG